ncbi:MAG: hypothetical protein AAF411_30355, partial [Myxococcota bacterium]
ATPNISAVDLDSASADDNAVDDRDQDFGYSPEDQEPGLGAIGDTVWFDEDREKLRICATLGVQTQKLAFEFVKRPEVRVYASESSDTDAVEPLYASSAHMILSPITIECDVRDAPSREELRDICDSEKTPDKIRAALEAG